MCVCVCVHNTGLHTQSCVGCLRFVRLVNQIATTFSDKFTASLTPPEQPLSRGVVHSVPSTVLHDSQREVGEDRVIGEHRCHGFILERERERERESEREGERERERERERESESPAGLLR